MGVVRFYQVKGETPAAVDAVLPRLLEKASDGRKVAVVCGNASRMLRLDESLWGYDADSFLPHGLGDGPFTEQQPIVLACVEEEGCMASVDGRLPVVLAGAESLLDGMEAEMVVFVFESSMPVLERARGMWRRLKEQGVSLEYWEQGEKGWQRKAG